MASDAEVLYSSVPDPWHLDSVPEGGVGVPTRGVTITSTDAGAVGPLHPLATTLIVAVPLNAGDQVTVAEVPFPAMVLPFPVTDQV